MSTNLINKLLLTTTLSVASLLLPQTSFCSDLERILNSSEIARYKHASSEESYSLLSEKWFKPGENFTELFHHKKGPDNLNHWFDIPADSIFKKAVTKGSNQKNYVTTYREYVSNEKIPFGVEVLVPHPRYEDSVKFGLMEEFARFSPPELKVEFTEDITIASHSGKLYTLPENQCQINLSLDRMALVVFSAPCDQTDTLVKLAEQFSYERFILKLNT